MKRISVRPAALSAAALLALLATPTPGPRSNPAAGLSGSIAYAAPTAKAIGEPSEAAKKDFLKLLDTIKQKIAAAMDKEKAAKAAVTTLQKYATDHAGDPIADSARLTSAQLQLQLGQPDQAIIALRKLAATAKDKQAGYMAHMMLAQALIQTNKPEEAEKLLNEIVTKNEDPDLTAAAKQSLVALAIRPG